MGFPFERTKEASDAINNSIAITGVARSGTTIVGKLVSSLASVEYFFEPPLILPIFLSTDEAETAKRSFLLESYLYDELLLGALSGRSVNTNRGDDSCIFNVKKEEEINERLSKTWRRAELTELAVSRKICFKIPSAPEIFQQIKDLYPDLRILYVHRKPQEVINSLIAKAWFRPKEASESVMWPWKWVGKRTVPWWVPAEDADRFYDYDEVNRCAYYYLRITNCAQEDDFFEWIYYDQILRDPHMTLRKIADKSCLGYGPKTIEVIGGISRRSPVADDFVLKKISRDLASIYVYA